MSKTYEQVIKPRRSFILVPGTQPGAYARALGSGADIVAIELEDGVSIEMKESARQNIRDLFSGSAHLEKSIDGEVECAVRINCLRNEQGMKDVQMLLDLPRPPTTLIIPKVIGPEEIIWLEGLLANQGHQTRLHVIIETNQALHYVWDIANCSPSIDALYFGGRDMAADLGCGSTWNALLYSRSRIVHAAASVGIDAIDVPFLEVDNLPGLENELRQAKLLGFTGKGVIHPKHISLVNTTFTPEEREVEYARKVIKAFDTTNSGIVVVDGRYIEKPALRGMQRILSAANLELH